MSERKVTMLSLVFTTTSLELLALASSRDVDFQDINPDGSDGTD
jgi:hypothetical protein